MDALLVKDEALRSGALEQRDVLISAKDPILEDLARLAAEACGAAVGVVCVAEESSGRLKTIAGLDGESLVLDGRLLDRVAVRHEAGGDVVVIEDLQVERGFAPDGFSVGDQAYCFYAAAPVLLDRVKVGVLAVLNDSPRELTGMQAEMLGILARQVTAQLEMNERNQRIAMTAQSQQKMVSAVLDTIGALVVVFDMDGRIVRFNRACERISGYSFDTLAGSQAWDQLIPAEEISGAIEDFEQLRRGSFPATFENRWRNRDGTLRHLSWAATALLDSNDEVAFLIATGTDVTAQRAADLTLRESEARYRQLVESSLGMVFTHDMEGLMLSVNTHGAATVGRTAEEMVGRPLAEFVPPKRRQGMKEYLQTIAATGEAQGLLHLAHVDDGLRVIAYRNKLITVPERTPYVLGVGVDITGQVRAERELRTLTRQSDSILESVGDGIFCIDLEGKVTLVNTAAAQMLGYRQEEILGRQMHTLIQHSRGDGRAYLDEDSPIRRSLLNFGTVRMRDELFWRKDGTSLPVEYVARPLLDTQMNESAEIRPVGVVVAFTDTTERRALDRMKDEFISTVSHELRTPLTSLRAALGLLTGALEDRPEKSRQMLEIALNNTDRLAKLVNDIVDLERISSGKNELRLEMVQAEDLLRVAVEKMRERAPGLEAKLSLSAEEVSVWVDRERVLQVLHNLLSNATKFSEPEGEIRLTARALDGQAVLFEVRDHGRGIPEDRLEYIFDRFRQGDASDSRALGGTGLGLAICRGVVTQHGGQIWATSSPGQGTTVHFTLPVRPKTNLR